MKKTIGIVCALVLTSVWASTTAMAADNMICGDGKWERSPTGSKPSADEQCDPGSNFKVNANVCYRSLGRCWLTQKAINNGIIDHIGGNHKKEKIRGEWEECDDYNLNPDDGCDKGVLTNAKVYPNQTDKNKELLCGNGVLDIGENCDTGSNEAFKGACNPSCQILGKSDTNYQCENITLCGDGVVDTAAGEQCDNGKMNGTPNNSCTKFCTWSASNPSFELNNTLFYPFKVNNKNNKIDIGGSEGGPPLDPKEHASKVSILERGRVVKIAHDENKQYSGIIPSGQSIENGVTVSFRYHSAKPGKTIFDDDQVGLVFGIKPSDIEGTDEEAKKANYIMLSWKDDLNQGSKANIQPSRCGTSAVSQGDQGLRVYHITGRPEYNELWQRKDCGKPGDDVHITEIVTDKRTKINKERINPAYYMTPYYTWDLNIIPKAFRNQSWVVQQIKAIYSVSGLQVYLNGQLAIDIDGSKIKNWPTTGEWGFYFLGMDNLIADFRDLNHRLINPENNNLFLSEESTSNVPNHNAKGTRCGYCGDGILQSSSTKLRGPETCDDGDTSDGDGCSTSCTIETGWACDTGVSPSVCYKGAITFPAEDGVVPTTTPVIRGTFEGSPANIKVVIKNENSTSVACSGFVQKDKIDTINKTWSFDTSSCSSNHISSGNKYTVSATLSGPSNKISEIKTGEVTFSVDTAAPHIVVTNPSTDPYAYNGSTSTKLKLEGKHTSKNPTADNLSITYDLKGETLKDKSSSYSLTDKATTPNNNGHWTANQDLPEDLKEGKYKVIIKATNNATGTTNPIMVEKTIYVDNTVPQDLEVEGENGSKLVNNGKLPTNNGKVNLKGSLKKAEEYESPLKEVTVTITSKDDPTKTTTTTVPINEDGSFSVDNMSLPDGVKNGSAVKVTVTAKDLAGNETSNNYDTLIADDTAVATPKGPSFAFNSPRDGATVGPQDLDSGGNLTVTGSSAPGSFDPNGDFKVEYCELNLSNACVGGSKQEVNTKDRNPSSGDWSAEIPNLKDNKKYRIFVSGKLGDTNETKSIDIGVDTSDISKTKLSFVEPNDTAKTLKIDDEGKLSFKVKVDDNSSTTKIKENQEGTITLRDNKNNQLAVPCEVKIEGSEKFCIGSVDLTDPTNVIGDSVSATAEIKLPNGSEAQKAELDNVAIDPKIAITSPAANGTSSTEPPTVIEGTSSGLDSGTTPIIVLCKLENDGSCTKGNEIVLTGEDLEVDDQGKWKVKPAAIEKHKDKLKQPGEYTVTTYIEVGTTSPKQRVMRDQTTYTVVEPATPTNPQQPSTPTIKCVKETPNCTLAQTNDGKIIVELEGGTPNETFTVEIEDSNGNKITKTGSYDANGKFRGEYEPKADNGNDMKAPYTITLKDSAGAEVNKKTGVTLTDSTEEVLGRIAGGCGCASTTPTEGILSLLLAALGLGFMRRRRK